MTEETPLGSVDVELRGVVKRFGDFTAVEGLDLTVERGQFVTLLGPSGCGKTTTLRMIGGFEPPDEGTIRVAGVPVVAGRQKGRVTRMVFQDYALFPHMTVAQNVAFGLRVTGVPRATMDAEVGKVAELLGLSGQLSKQPHEMSGGQQQRVAVARALVTRPKVLLLDEPLGALDLKMRKRMQNELKTLQREVGITFVYVTHDQEEALNLSDTVVVMDHGHVVQHGSPVDVYDRPRTAYVADFIGEANLIPGRVREVRADEATVETTLGMVVGRLADGFTPAGGDAVLLAVRPEHVIIDGAHSMSVRGTLTESAFLGSVTRLGVATHECVVRADVKGVYAGSVGANVTIGWRPERVSVLPSDPRFAA